MKNIISTSKQAKQQERLMMIRKSHKVNKIKEAHNIQPYQGRQKSMMVFSVTTARKVTQLNQIKKAHNIQSQGWKKEIEYFHCNDCQKKV